MYGFHFSYAFSLAVYILDANLKDGIYEWRDGRRYVKEGDKLYLEGTDTLAGRCARVPPLSPRIYSPRPRSAVTLDKCVRNFTRFTGCSLGEAIKCATYNPAR